jgi:hypothetical protein
MEKSIMSFLRNFLSALWLAYAVGLPALADTRVAVLDFELKDVTALPDVPEEVARTASLKPLLERALTNKGDYRFVSAANSGSAVAGHAAGYLWDHPDEAAKLGKHNDARFVVAGRVHKPSFLFVYFMARVIDADTGKLIGDFTIEVKGQQQKLTPIGIENLAARIDTALRQALEPNGGSNPNAPRAGLAPGARSEEKQS